MTEFLPTSTETLRWGVRPHRGEADAAFVRELADRDLTAPPRHRETWKIIEVNDEPAGIVVLRKTKISVHLVDLRLIDRWRWRGIEKEVVAHLARWANENSLVLKRPKGVDFPDSVPVGKLVRESVALWKAREKEKAWTLSGRTILIFFLSFFALLFIFSWAGLSTPTTLTSNLRYLRLDSLRARLTSFIILMLAAASPALLAELRGRLAGGAVVADIGSRGRRWWVLATVAFVGAATASFLLGGWSLDTGGAMGFALLVPAGVTGLFALRRGQVREGGILRPGLPGFIPWDAVAGWVRGKRGPILVLARHVPGGWTNRVRLPDRPEVKDRLGKPLDSPPSFQPNLLPLVVAAVILTISFDKYVDDIPKERPPGVVAFAVDPDAHLDIGEESSVALFPFRQTGVAGGWEALDRDMIDHERERIDAVLLYRDVDGRPAETTMAVDRYG